MRKLGNIDIITNLRVSDERVVDQTLATLYQAYYPMIKKFISDNHGSEEDAADIFQDSLIVLYDKARDPNFTLTCAEKLLFSPFAETYG